MLKWLQKWYADNCDGSWEHMNVIKIESLDNPGWLVKINLEDTALEGEPFEEINYDNGDDDWLCCRINGNLYYCAGDPSKLETMLSIFKEWAETICPIE
ncbi:MAG: immunity 53 family protein [Oscillospiraceae bacterium]|nr:immunity 53 family protein [Oscillospiraceae bacterium]